MSANVTPDPSDTQHMVLAEERAALKVREARLVCINPDVVPDESDLSMVVVDVSPFTIGRGKSNNIVLNVSGVSRSHLRLTYLESGWEVADAGSANGIEVNKSVVERQILKGGEIISLGKIHFKFSLQSDHELVEDAEHQVSLFDVEQTMVVNRHEVQTAVSLPTGKTSPSKPVYAPARSKRWMFGLVIVAVVATVAIALLR